ncbi:MAG: enoyl-CoA hydratase [Deltaproteobacteria bacterium]|nr:MAG: enoyl-CoA hydratase [Deltaproteobacteria bacterium]
MSELVLEEDLGHARLWRLNRPEVMNALSRALRAELEARVDAVATAAEVRAVVLTGAGEKAFCAGADLKERRSMSEAEVRAWLGDLGRTFRKIETSPKVFIAAIDGYAFGGGLELALACDLRVAAREAKMGLTETRLAILPGGGGTQRLPRLVGRGRASDLILTGRRIGGEEAFRMGVVERLAAPGQRALDLALEVAEELAGCGPVAVAKAKEAIVRGLDQPMEEGLRTEYACYEATLGTEDRLEGLRAFEEKRPPRYRGK